MKEQENKQQQALQESHKMVQDNEQLMKAAEQLAGFGSWQLDVDRGLVKWSDGAFRIYGYNPGECKPSYTFFLTHVHGEDLEYVKGKLAYAWQYLNAQKLDFRIIDREGVVKYLQTELVIERDTRNKPLRITGFKQDITEKMILASILEKERLFRQQEITEAAIIAQEQERLFLGAELHENINPILATVRLYLDCAMSDEQRCIDLMKDAKGFVSVAMNEIRNLSKSVLPPSLGEVGLLNALNDLVENTTNLNKLDIDTNWNDIHENNLSEKLKLAIFRIVQEQLNNILKHANAKKISISLEQVKNKLVLRIKDDGIGFERIKKRTCVGIRNIISRADLFSGQVQINSLPDGDCELIVDFIDIDRVDNNKQL